MQITLNLDLREGSELSLSVSRRAKYLVERLERNAESGVDNTAATRDLADLCSLALKLRDQMYVENFDLGRWGISVAQAMLTRELATV